MAHILNRTAAKKYILEQAKLKRPHLKLERVSKEALDDLEADIKLMIRNRIDTHPSIGKTFKP